MSRFTPSRWNKILAWTGASLAWGTAFVAAKVEPLRAQETSSEPASETTARNAAALPQPPASGLSIIRYVPTVVPEAEVQKVYVTVAVPARQQASASRSGATVSQTPTAPLPAVSLPPPPNPPSSGS